MGKAGKSGITSNTPNNIMFGAGTIHKNLKFEFTVLASEPSDWSTKYTSYYTRSGTAPNYTYTHVTGQTAPEWAADTYYKSAWNFDASIMGATQGGSKISIKPEFTNIEVDGALVPVKGLKVKTGETASMEFNFLEVTKDILKMAVVGTDGTSADSNFDVIESTAFVQTGDYLDNVAFVGQTLDGRNIMVIMDNALCTSGFESNGKNKEAGVFTCTFECHADLTSDMDTLPYHIYYPTASV